MGACSAKNAETTDCIAVNILRARVAGSLNLQLLFHSDVHRRACVPRRPLIQGDPYGHGMVFVDSYFEVAF